MLTINTIECVLRLPGAGERAGSVESGGSGEEGRARPGRREEQTAPPGYLQNLINKIISNIQIVCNNLILKGPTLNIVKRQFEVLEPLLFAVQAGFKVQL